MRLIKLAVPAALIAVLAPFTPRAGAQTMGEYASTAGVATGGGSMGAGGGSDTWGANGLGGSFEDRAGAASASGAGSDFDSRAGSMASLSTAESRWPGSAFGATGAASRFGDSSARFPDKDRFLDDTGLSPTTDRFPPSLFNDNRNGLDTTYDRSGLDTPQNRDGLDNSGTQQP